MKTIVLINGLPRAGKDTVANFMIKQGYNKLSFANSPKEIVARTFNITMEELDEYKNNTDSISIDIKRKDSIIIKTDFRQVLQLFCSEAMKPIYGDSVWADIVYKQILDSDKELFVVPDFRFLSEYQKHDNIKVITILVKDFREQPINGHISDIELYKHNFSFDHTIMNTGTIKDLELKVRELIVQI